MVVCQGAECQKEALLEFLGGSEKNYAYALEQGWIREVRE